MGGGGKGGKGGGGGGASIDVNTTSTSMVDSQSASTVTSNSANQIDSRSTAQLQIVGLDNVKVDQKSDAKNEVRLAITEPIRTEATSKTELDVKPLQAQLCLKVGVERFPSTRIHKPLARHFGLTLFGTEILGFNFSEDRTTVIEDLGSQPFVLGAPREGCQGGGAARARPEGGGLRIRVGGH